MLNADPPAAHLSREIPQAARRRGGPATRPDQRVAVPAEPQRPHHRSWNRPRRPLLHSLDRPADAGHLARPDQLQHRCRVLRVPRRHGLRPRRPQQPVPHGDRVLGPRSRAVRGAVAHHPHHQRRATGPDAGAHDVHPARRRTHHDRRRCGDGASRRRRPFGHPARQHPRARRLHQHGDRADGAAVPGDAGQDRFDQQSATRTDHRHPRRASLRTRAR